VGILIRATMPLTDRALDAIERRAAKLAAAKQPPSRLTKLLPPKAKPKFNRQLRDRVELASRKYGNMYSETPKDPEILAEMQASFRGRKELQRAAKNEAAGKRLGRNAGIGFGTLMTGAIGVGQYQESERKKQMKPSKPNNKNKAPATMAKPKAKSKKVLPKKMGK